MVILHDWMNPVLWLPVEKVKDDIEHTLTNLELKLVIYYHD